MFPLSSTIVSTNVEPIFPEVERVFSLNVVWRATRKTEITRYVLKYT